MKKARQRSQIDANFQSIPFNYIQPLAIPPEEAYQTHLPCQVDPSMISSMHRHTQHEIHYLYPKLMSNS